LLLKKFSLVLVLILFFGGIPTFVPRVIAESNVTIAINTLNVREGPGLSYRVVKQVNKGESFLFVKEENDWIQIKLLNNQYGWVANWLVQKENTQGTPDNQTISSSGSVAVDGLRVRNGPGLSFQTIGHVNKDVKVTILEKNENWIKISSGLFKGWVSSEFVTVSNGQAPHTKKEKTSTKGLSAIVTVDSLNVRSNATLQANIIGKLQKGEKIEIISSITDWVQIEFSGQKAWISTEFIEMEGQPVNKEEKSTSQPTDLKGIIGTVTANGLNVRGKADLTGNIVGNVLKGSSFTILEEKNNWSKIEYSPKKYGWVNTWYLEKSIPKTDTSYTQEVKEGSVTILYDGTNIRNGPSVQTRVVIRANVGDRFPVKSLKGEWYEILLEDGSLAYIAGWIVSVSGSAPQVEKPGAEVHLKNKTIVLDPGHGGGDNGTTGARGTLEKDLTLRTSILLYDKLRASGANVILTRTNDSYYSLRSRVSTASYHKADAFISIHYDSILDRSVRGMTTYYYHSYQKSLAEAIHNSTIDQTKLRDRGARFGDYHVIRETNQKAILLELGYLSNPAEETTVSSPQYQEMAAIGIFNGLAKYFKSNY
jgi:N-acetylmuramoyl-L-alanine amidase